LSPLWLREGPKEPSEFDGDPAKTLAAKALDSILRTTLCFDALYLAFSDPLFVVTKTASSVFWGVITAVTALAEMGLRETEQWDFLVNRLGHVGCIHPLFGRHIESRDAQSHRGHCRISLARGPACCIWITALSLALIAILTILESIGVHTIVEAIRDHRGEPVRTIGSIEDVTEQVMGWGSPSLMASCGASGARSI
jgi:hypothetical protein